MLLIWRWERSVEGYEMGGDVWRGACHVAGVKVVKQEHLEQESGPNERKQITTLVLRHGADRGQGPTGSRRRDWLEEGRGRVSGQAREGEGACGRDPNTDVAVVEVERR